MSSSSCSGQELRMYSSHVYPATKGCDPMVKVCLSDRGREGLTPPRPPNRTGGFPSYGSPVGSSLIGSVWQSAKLCKRAARLERRGRWPPEMEPKIFCDAVTSADIMRAVQIKASTHNQVRASTPCIALAGTDGAFSASFWSIPHPPSYPAFPRCGFAFRTFHGSSPQRYYAGSDSCRASHNATGLSVPSAGLLDIPSPTTSCARTSRAYHLVRPVGSLRSQASRTPRMLATTRRRIGFVFLQAIHSPPAAPHLASRRRSCL